MTVFAFVAFIVCSSRRISRATRVTALSSDFTSYTGGLVDRAVRSHAGGG